MKTKILIVLLLSASAAIAQIRTMDQLLNEADQLLSQVVKGGRVDYDRLKKNPKQLQAIRKAIGVIQPKQNEEKAFWINAYNLLVIASVVDHYPLGSVMDLDGFFNKSQHTVSGRKMSLDYLEKQVLYKKYSDARLHFVLVCAAWSCPPLPAAIYRPATLEKQIEQRTKQTLNSWDFIKVKAKSKQVEVSKIFEWYAGDFGGKAGIIPFLNKYRSSTIPASFQVTFAEYNWKLNE